MRTVAPQKIIRVSPSILIIKLVVLEIILIILNSLFSFVLAPFLGPASVILFAVISIFEMVATAVIVALWMSEVYYIYGDFIIHRIGIFQIKEEEYSLRNIEALTVDQSFLGRIFNFGTLHFFSPVLRQEYYLTNIPDAFEVRNIVESIVSEAKSSGSREKIIYRR